MEFFPLLVYLLIFLSSLLLLIRATIRRRPPRRRLNLPPGPAPWPIIGNLNLIGALPHRSIHALSLRYGPLMQLRFGSFPVVVGSSTAMASAFLKTHDLAFSDRPRIAAGKLTTYNYSNITWSPYGPYWRQARKMCATELFSAKRLDSFEHVRTDELRALLRNLFHSAGKPIAIKGYLSTLSLNVISRMVLGKKYAAGEAEELKRMIDELFFLNGVMNVGDWIPWIEWLDVQGYVGRMKSLAGELNGFLERVLDEHELRRRREGEGWVAGDLVDVLLRLAEEPEMEVTLRRDGVKAFTQDLLAGGTESSAVTVEWALSELLKRPETLSKATKELDAVIGNGAWVEEKDMRKLPYVAAVIKETMRIHPVAPMLVPRRSREDVVIDGYDVPAGTGVLLNVWTIGRDPAVWEAPEEFRPERFMVGKPIDVKGTDFELLPFGGGRRMCPGYSLGMKVIEMSLANLLHGFRWRLPPGMDVGELNMEEVFGLSTPRKVPLEVVAEPRLPAHLYA